MVAAVLHAYLTWLDENSLLVRRFLDTACGPGSAYTRSEWNVTSGDMQARPAASRITFARSMAGYRIRVRTPNLRLVAR